MIKTSFQNTLREPQKQLTIKQHELTLEHLKDLSLKKLSGWNGKLKFSKIMLTVILKSSKNYYQDIQDLQSKLKEPNLEKWLKRNQDILQGDISLKEQGQKEKETEMMRMPGFEPGQQAWEAWILTRLDHIRITLLMIVKIRNTALTKLQPNYHF